MPPFVLLALLLGATYGALFHFWRGKNLPELAIYLLTGVIGFGLGQVIGRLLGLNLLLIGPLHIIEATVVSWGSLFLVKWLKV
jgi:hypothetical protein